MADPIFGSKYGPQNGVQNWITFSCLLLGLCLGPVLGSRFGPKSGASHRKILLLPADVLQADLRRTSMSVSVNACFFSLCVPICFLYSIGQNLELVILTLRSRDAEIWTASTATAAAVGLDIARYQEYILLSNGLVQRTPCECSLTDEDISYIDDQLIDQLGLEGITITDSSTVRVARVFVQQSYTELACFRSFF